MELKGFIYKIINSENDKIYVGQTKNNINDRLKEHIKKAKKWLKQDPLKRSTVKLFSAMNNIGYEKFSIVLIEECDYEEIDDRESYYINLYNTVENGYNIRHFGSHYIHTEETKNKISETMTKIMENNIDKYRKHEEVKGLPMYVIYAKVKGYPAICINNHPKCSRKSFVARDGKTIEECKALALAFLDTLNQSDEVYKYKEKGDLPKGVNKKPKGYEVRKIINGTFHYKSFQDSSKTDEENKTEAINYLQLITENVQRLSVSRSLEDELQELKEILLQSIAHQEQMHKNFLNNLQAILKEAQDIVRPT